MKKMFSCSSSQVAVESWNKHDQKLFEAVEKGDVGRVAVLAARKTARPTKLNAMGQSAFHLAASKGLTECLTLLLAHGAPVNEKNDDGSTALHLATIACQPQCVKVLLQYGANEGHVDGQSRTPLHWAASSGCASSVLLLCDHEALLDVTDGNGQTPLMIAARGNHAAICAQLLQRGADPNLADKDMKTALILACESCSVEAAELLLSHGAAAAAQDRMGHDAHHYAWQAPSRVLRRLLRATGSRVPSRGEGTAAGKGAGCPGDAEMQVKPAATSLRDAPVASDSCSTHAVACSHVSQAAPACNSTDDSEEEEEEEEGCDAEEWRCRCEAERAKVLQLEQQLVTKVRECEWLSAARRTTARSLWQRVRELEQLLLGTKSEAGTEPEDDYCLTLLAEHLRELRRRKEEAAGGLAAPEEEEERQQGEPEREDACRRLRELEDHSENPPATIAAAEQAQLDGDEQRLWAPLALFLSWLEETCTKLRAEKLTVFTRSKGLRKEVEEALRSKLHYEVVSADAVRKSLAAWEKLALGLEQALSHADESHAELLRRSRPLLETLRALQSQRELEEPLDGAAPSRSPENGRAKPEEVNPSQAEKSQSQARTLEREAEERPRARSSKLEKEVLELKESNGRLLGELAQLGRERERLQEELRGLRERDASAAAATEGPGQREETTRLRRRLAAQRRELAVLRDSLGAQAQEEAGNQLPGACILQELHCKLDGLVRTQHEALQLVSQMEGEGEALGDAPRPPGERDPRGRWDEDGGDGPAAGAALRSREEMTPDIPEGSRALRRELEAASAEAARWAEAAAAERRAKEELEVRAAEREQEARELQVTSRGLERSVEKLSAKVGELARACQDKEGKIKQLLAEMEKLSAEVLAVRSESVRLQLRLELQQKNHQDIVTIYRTHLLNAAQGFMDEVVHGMLLRILRTGDA
ncbi:ankyrin repeat domain-containing protein 35 [Struthio camelus]|uniref:ankyrin repeat domain-containing protein 35 n=1 Tax=Struthio camelus TaxID=8801 RepID=UPI003604210E